MKKTINPFDYAGQICNAMSKGILLTTKDGAFVNTMTIGWGSIGVEWGKPIFTAYVRENRYTRHILSKNPEFTVNIPMEAPNSGVIAYCGRNSGRDVDKIAQMGLSLEQPQSISVPGIREFPLTLECKVRYWQAQDISKLPKGIQNRYYPQNVDGTNPGSNQDYHIAFYGEIVDAYIIQ